ncbi:MAG TPA: hypothetical protein VFW33_08720 [Gemmataceae bacterium]|nr:hypothetical protein [Gemmataceae bacterium]
MKSDAMTPLLSQQQRAELVKLTLKLQDGIGHEKENSKAWLRSCIQLYCTALLAESWAPTAALRRSAKSLRRRAVTSARHTLARLPTGRDFLTVLNEIAEVNPATAKVIRDDVKALTAKTKQE